MQKVCVSVRVERWRRDREDARESECVCPTQRMRERERERETERVWIFEHPKVSKSWWTKGQKMRLKFSPFGRDEFLASDKLFLNPHKWSVTHQESGVKEKSRTNKMSNGLKHQNGAVEIIKLWQNAKWERYTFNSAVLYVKISATQGRNLMLDKQWLARTHNLWVCGQLCWPSRTKYDALLYKVSPSGAICGVSRSDVVMNPFIFLLTCNRPKHSFNINLESWWH